MTGGHDDGQKVLCFMILPPRAQTPWKRREMWPTTRSEDIVTEERKNSCFRPFTMDVQFKVQSIELRTQGTRKHANNGFNEGLKGSMIR